MISKTVDEAYAVNDAVREKLRTVVASVHPAMHDALPKGEKWTIANIVEHLALVEASMIRICSKLLRKAEAASALGDGTIVIGDAFIEKGNEFADVKIEAPEIVRPTTEKNTSESFSMMDENRVILGDLKPMFVRFDTTNFRFPHPFFGDLSAGEWLSLLGGHEARHIRQIKRIIRDLRE